jgi:hypothetical protein
VQVRIGGRQLALEYPAHPPNLDGGSRMDTMQLLACSTT